jgi:hypothetical protein
MDQHASPNLYFPFKIHVGLFALPAAVKTITLNLNGLIIPNIGARSDRAADDAVAGGSWLGRAEDDSRRCVGMNTVLGIWPEARPHYASLRSGGG